MSFSFRPGVPDELASVLSCYNSDVSLSMVFSLNTELAAYRSHKESMRLDHEHFLLFKFVKSESSIRRHHMADVRNFGVATSSKVNGWFNMSLFNISQFATDLIHDRKTFYDQAH